MRIRVIDLETTGFEPPEHTVCEIGWCDLVATSDLAGGWREWIVTGGGHLLVDPGRPIPPETSAIHHIIDEDVSDAPAWDSAWPAVAGGNKGERIDLFAAHNARFERQWCVAAVAGGRPWICTYKAALRLWRDAPVHSNQGLRYWRRPEGLDRDVASVAHRAFPDAYVTAFLLRDMLNDGAAVEDLVRWTGEPALQVKCHIGKWRGTPWSEVDIGFLYWVADRDFDEDVIFTARHEIEHRRKLQEVR